jgi:hypothetical protein
MWKLSVGGGGFVMVDITEGEQIEINGGKFEWIPCVLTIVFVVPNRYSLVHKG